MLTKRISPTKFKKQLLEGYGEVTFDIEKCKTKRGSIRKGMMKKYLLLKERKEIYRTKLEKI